jgi:signal transduction histidine kinase
MAKSAPITIPTEPIGSIPRPPDLIEGIANGDSEDPGLDTLYEDAIRDTIVRFEAAGSRELKIRSQQTESEAVMVSVTDSGIGLPKQADRIFDAFFTTKPHGTGMGLRISRSIIESRGGRLRAANNSPRGASFCFTLPTKAEA